MKQIRHFGDIIQVAFPLLIVCFMYILFFKIIKNQLYSIRCGGVTEFISDGILGCSQDIGLEKYPKVGKYSVCICGLY